jgi:DNA-binding XRE family transcriptional regulator
MTAAEPPPLAFRIARLFAMNAEEIFIDENES